MKSGTIFSGILIRPVGVAAARDDDGRRVRRVIGQREQIGRGFARGVGTSRPQRIAFARRTLRNVAVDFVGRHLQHARYLLRAQGLEENVRPERVGSQEGPRVDDRTIDVRLGGEVHQCLRARADRLAHRRRIADVALDKAISRIPFDLAQVLRIGGVRHRIEIDDLDVRTFAQHEPNEVRADEAQASGDDPAHCARLSVSRRNLP